MSEWEAVPVRRIFKVANGGTPTAGAENWDGDVPWATPADLARVNGSRLTSTARTLTAEGLRSGSTLVPTGSLIVSTRAPIGYVAEATTPVAFNQGCRGLVPRVEIDTRFFRYQLLALTQDMNARGQGTTFLELSTDALASLPVYFPRLDQQRVVADFLEAETARIDALIEKKEQMIALAQEQVEARVEVVIRDSAEQHGEARLKYMAREVTVGIVVTPSHWYGEAGVPALRGVNVSPGRVRLDDLVYLTAEGHALHQKSRLVTGDLVTVRTGQAGATAVVPHELDGANCIDLLITRPALGVSAAYLEAVMNSDWCRKHVAKHAVGAIQSHFNVEALKALPVPLLPKHDQESLASRVRRMRGHAGDVVATLERQIELLAEHRQALITAAVTGALDVGVAA